MEYRANKVTFFVSYFEAMERIESNEEKLAFITSLLRYAFLGEVPDFDDKLAGMFELLKPNIDKSLKNISVGAINGSKGGAPPGNQNARKKTTSQGLNEIKTEMDKEKDMGYGNEGSTNSCSGEKSSSVGNINFGKIYSTD